MTLGAETVRIDQYGEYRLSAINDSGELIKNREYFLKFEAKFLKAFKYRLRG
jgi:hypothetical protein